MALVLLVFAFVFACVAASNLVPEPHRTRLIAASLASYYAVEIFGRWYK